jgi:hypothetical protein
MKYSINEFAHEIRKIHPGHYDDLSDNKLVALWLKKFPADVDKVELQTKSSWGAYVFYGVLIYVGLSFINKEFKKIGFINEFNGRVFGWNSIAVRAGSLQKSIINDRNGEEEIINPSNNTSTSTELNEDEINSSSEYSNQNDISDGSSINDSYESNSSSSQSSQTEKRKCSTCGGNGQCSKCSKPQRVRYKQGESPKDHNEIRLGMIVCPQCGGNLMNFGADKNESCYLCKATGWKYCPECNIYGEGRNIGKCQRCDGTGFDK